MPLLAEPLFPGQRVIGNWSRVTCYYASDSLHRNVEDACSLATWIKALGKRKLEGGAGGTRLALMLTLLRSVSCRHD